MKSVAIEGRRKRETEFSHQHVGVTILLLGTITNISASRWCPKGVVGFLILLLMFLECLYRSCSAVRCHFKCVAELALRQPSLTRASPDVHVTFHQPSDFVLATSGNVIGVVVNASPNDEGPFHTHMLRITCMRIVRRNVPRTTCSLRNVRRNVHIPARHTTRRPEWMSMTLKTLFVPLDS